MPDLVFGRLRVRFSPRKIFVAPGEHGFSFFLVKMFTESVSVLFTSTSLKIFLKIFLKISKKLQITNLKFKNKLKNKKS